MEFNVKVKLFLLLFIMSLNFANEPLPPPYHKFYISGIIVCDTLANKSNYTVQLFGKSRETNYQLRPVFSYRNRNNIALTDSTGQFYLEADSDIELDSISVAVVLPQSEYIFSITYCVDKESRREELEYYNVDSGSGCNSCTSSVDAQHSRVAYYKYYIENTKINICD